MLRSACALGKVARAPAATPSDGQAKPERRISVSSRRGWGPAASERMSEWRRASRGVALRRQELEVATDRRPPNLRAAVNRAEKHALCVVAHAARQLL